MDARLRVGLFARMGVAALVLLTLSLVLATIFAFFGVLVALTLPGVVVWFYELIRGVPRLSMVLSAPPWAVAVAAFLELWMVNRHWSRISPYTRSGYLFPPSGMVSGLLGALTLGCVYELVVESGVALGSLVSTAYTSVWVWAVTLLGFALLGVVTFVVGIRREVEATRERSIEGKMDTTGSDERLTGIVRRLAQSANVPAPTVRVVQRDRPTAFTIGGRRNATVVLSKGLVDLLPDDELEAVLAHEVSHLANGDSRLMAAALAPVVVAGKVFDPEESGGGGLFGWSIEKALFQYGQFGAAILSRGREWAADSAAAELTGSPASLASALVRLDEHRGTPQQDAREWSDAFVALDVLPTLDPAGNEWVFRTHPPTDERIARLYRLAERMECS